MESTKFWSRVGHWFRRPQHSPDRSRAARPRAAVHSSEEDALTHDDAESPLARSPSSRAIRSRWSRPNPHLERLESEYARVVNLIDAIQGHLASQVEQSRNIAGSLERLAQGVSILPEASRQELELLTAISESVSADLASAKRLEENLAQLPQLADAQRQTMVSIDRQLDAARQADERLNGTMNGVGDSISKLREVADTSGKALQAIRWDASARDERMATLVQEQTKRITIFAWSAIGLAAVAALIGVIALLR